MLSRSSLCALIGCLSLAGCASSQRTDKVALNQIQVIGTHNSYHQRPHPAVMKLISAYRPEVVSELEYGHRPLHEQLDLGVRQLELDCYADPTGGRFAHPLGPKQIAASGQPPVPSHDPTGELLQPGIKVLHVPDVDFRSSVLTLADGLKEILNWSRQHPRHVPIFILIEFKTETIGPMFTQALPWDATQLAALESEILSVFSPREIIKPDDVRGNSSSLPDALRQHGWPLLDQARGKVMFGMDNEGSERDEYLRDHPALEHRILFVSVPRENPAAAWMKCNDPIHDFDRIQELVKAGFLVRTRADEPTANARKNDTGMRDRALASGAQFVSTDYPEPDPALSPYCVQLDGRHPARANPVNGPTNLDGLDLDK